jgi:hypothetical protein
MTETQKEPQSQTDESSNLSRATIIRLVCVRNAARPLYLGSNMFSLDV